MRHFRNLYTARIISTSLLVSTVLVALAGCGDGKIERFPVTGSVLVDGKPAEGAVVMFCPIGGSEELQKLRPFGIAAADGKFQLTTFGATDGAPSGEYNVLVQWPAKGVGDERAPGAGRDRLMGRYMNLNNPQLTAKIEEGETDLPPFELKSR